MVTKKTAPRRARTSSTTAPDRAYLLGLALHDALVRSKVQFCDGTLVTNLADPVSDDDYRRIGHELTLALSCQGLELKPFESKPEALNEVLRLYLVAERHSIAADIARARLEATDSVELVGPDEETTPEEVLQDALSKELDTLTEKLARGER